VEGSEVDLHTYKYHLITLLGATPYLIAGSFAIIGIAVTSLHFGWWPIAAWVFGAIIAFYDWQYLGDDNNDSLVEKQRRLFHGI